MDVPDDDGELIISDSEDEREKTVPETGGISEVPSRTSTLATAKAGEANVFFFHMN